MKRIVFLSLTVLTFLSITSCKKAEEAKPESSETKKDYKQNFNVKIQLSASKKDDLALYYTEDGTINFKGEDAVWSGIKGGNIDEMLNFELAQDRIPTHMRLDFGMNTEQDSVVIKNVKVSYYENNYQFVGSDFYKYFIEDKQFNTKIDAAKGTFTIFKKDGAYKTPYYYPTQLTIDNIKKITTAK